MSYSIIVFMPACASLSQDFGFYKYAVGSFSSSETESDNRMELTYHGYENETVESAIAKWQREATGECNGYYRVVTDGFFSLPWLNEGTKTLNRDDLFIYFAEGEKWPQVLGYYECGSW